MEPAELEDRLLQHPGIVAAAVRARPAPDGVERLVAYLVTAAVRLDPRQVRAWDAQTLPDYLVPSAVVELGALPLTSTGNLDAEDGEICIRGEQRFDGYLDPADDRGRFAAFEPGGVATTIHGRPRPRPRPRYWYRTGDRGRMEGGFLVHHGRLDQQVKVRGHRVEIGDVEAAIHTHLGCGGRRGRPGSSRRR